MDGLGKKVGYLKGLMEGMDFSNDPSSEKLMKAMVELMGDLCDRVNSLEELMDDLNDYVESIDDDLSELESERDGDFRFRDDDNENEYFDDTDENEDRLHLLGGKAEEVEDETLAGAICPDCGRMFFVGADDPENALYRCPHCGSRVSPDPLTPENAPIARPEDPA